MILPGSGDSWARVWGEWKERRPDNRQGLTVKGIWILSQSSGEPEKVSEQGRSL